MKRAPTRRRPWTPLRFSHHTPDGTSVYGNDRYVVSVYEVSHELGGDAPMLVLSIHTHTRSAIGAHDWRHFQRIKNEIGGEGAWGFEFYPPESELHDDANNYWVWILPEGVALPSWLGFHTGRKVAGPDELLADPRPEVRQFARQRRLGGDA